MRDGLYSPGQATAERAGLEAAFTSGVLRELRVFLVGVRRDAARAVESPILLAAAVEPFALASVMGRWAMLGAAVLAQVSRKLPLAEDAVSRSEYLRAVERRLRDSHLPMAAYEAARSVLVNHANDPASTRYKVNRELAGALEAARGSEWHNQAERIARTEATSLAAHNQQAAMVEAGVEYKRWVAVRDSRTRPAHAAANGQTVRTDETFTVGGWAMQGPGDPAAPAEQTANCVPSDALVYGQATGAMRRWYSGPMVLVEVGGQQLAGTPNHPVLTEAGWVALGSMQVGDYLIGHSRQGQTLVTHHIEAEPAPICEAFDTLAMSLDPVRVGTGRVDFHGDGLDGEVDVVGAYGQLLDGEDTPADEFLRQFRLPFADMVTGDLNRASTAGPVLLGSGHPAHGVMSSPGIGGAFFWGARSGQEAVGGGPAAWLDSMLEQQSTQGGTTPPEFFSQRLLGLPGQITRQQVTYVGRVSIWEGHVFNLSTVTGAYVCNGIIVHNCRCSTVAVAAPERISVAAGATGV